MGSHSFFKGIFPTQGSNPGLLHYRQILYHLSHQGSLFYIVPYYVYIYTNTHTHTYIVYLYQIRSVAQLCLTVCDPMNRSTPGPPVHHQLPEFTQTHIHRVSDAIQPSHPLLTPSPPAPNPSQRQLIWYPNPTAWYPTDATMALWGVFFLPNSKIKFRKYLFLSHKLEGSKNSKDWYCNSNQNLLRLILLRSEHQSKSTSITAIFFLRL